MVQMPNMEEFNFTNLVTLADGPTDEIGFPSST